jgi:hypothetical protein
MIETIKNLLIALPILQEYRASPLLFSSNSHYGVLIKINGLKFIKSEFSSVIEKTVVSIRNIDS